MGLTYKDKLYRLERTGLCMQCNVTPAVQDRTLCAACLAEVTRRGKARYADRVSKRLCTECAAPLGDRKGRSCKECRAKLNKGGEQYRPADPAYRRKRQEEWWGQVFAHYGRRCACCGETEQAFLTVDHINNDGAKHRRELGKGLALRGWIVKHNWPKIFQILCWNCNCAKWRVGICPHEVERRRARFVVV
jgi:hypothetical protein